MTATASLRSGVRLAAFLLLLAGSASAKYAVVDVGSPHATGQDVIHIRVKDLNDPNHTITVPSFRTEDVPDGTDPATAAQQGGIVKGQTDDQKAQAIANAINNNERASGVVTATAVRGTVQVFPKPGFDLESIDVNGSDTKERVIIKMTDTADIVYTLPANEILIASVRFAGAVAGIGFDGEPGTVSVGTDRYVSELPTAGYRTVEELAAAVLHDLQSHGVRAELTSPDEILILVDPDIDQGIVSGTNDRTLGVSMSLGDI